MLVLYYSRDIEVPSMKRSAFSTFQNLAFIHKRRYSFAFYDMFYKEERIFVQINKNWLSSKRDTYKLIKKASN